MGKYSKYEKKYRKEWENLPIFKGWLQQAGSGSLENARCKLCNIDLRAHKTDLKKHAKSLGHKKKESAIPSNQNTLTQVGIMEMVEVRNEEKERDIKLATFVAMHTSLNTMNHLCDLLKLLGKGSELENLRIHRTKCTQVIKKVLAPSIASNIIEDVHSSDSYYSLILDESTDISTNKYLAVCIRYFSKYAKCIKTEYLGLINVNSTTAQDLYNAVTSFLKTNNLNLNKLIGIGTDGANNLCGKNHSLFTLLRNDVPHLQIIKCVCHSIHICSEKAADELPASVEFLVRETYNWFSLSAKRQNDYRSIYELININENKKQYKLIQIAATRWLSRFKAIERILEQWLELKTHFTQVNIQEKCYTARQLDEMYRDESNFLYLVFLRPVLKDLNSTNLLFQSTDADFFKVFENLLGLVLSILRRILKPIFMFDTEQNINKRIDNLKNAINNDLSFLNVDSIDYGLNFINEMNKSKLSNDKKKIVKHKCFNFLQTLARKLLDKLPDNFKTLIVLKNLSPEVCLSPARPSFNEIFPPELMSPNMPLDDLDSQYRNLLSIEWKNYFPNKEVPQNPIIFWAFVSDFQNAGGSYIFQDISDFALKLLCLPLSNAVVERVFSIMNIVKNKIRNRLTLDTLHAILMVRIFYKNNNLCCTTLVPNKKMYDLFNKSIYDVSETEVEEIDDILRSIDF